MSADITSISLSLIQKQAMTEILKCNEFTERYGLLLSHHDVIELVKTRTQALKNTGRIEFGGGVIAKIIREFCDSPYISKHNYPDILHELTEIFYYFKNETLDLLSDDDLIKFMKTRFDGICQGSLDLLAGRELINMARNIRYGYPPGYMEDDLSLEEEDIVG